MPSRIRLACIICDAELDGVRKIPKTWKDVYRIQSYKEATNEEVDVLLWMTHTGICPDCHRDDFPAVHGQLF